MRAEEIKPGMVLVVPAGADDIRKREYKLRVRIVGRAHTSRKLTLFGWIIRGEQITRSVMVDVNPEKVRRLNEEEEPCGCSGYDEPCAKCGHSSNEPGYGCTCSLGG